MSYAHVKFEVATSNGLEGDAIIRNVTGGRRTDFGTNFIYPFVFLKKKAAITMNVFECCTRSQESKLTLKRMSIFSFLVQKCTWIVL